MLNLFLSRNGIEHQTQCDNTPHHDQAQPMIIKADVGLDSVMVNEWLAKALPRTKNRCEQLHTLKGSNASK